LGKRNYFIINKLGDKRSHCFSSVVTHDVVVTWHVKIRTLMIWGSVMAYLPPVLEIKKYLVITCIY